MDDNDRYFRISLFLIFGGVAFLLTSLCSGNFPAKAFIFVLAFFLSMIWPKLVNIVSSASISLIYGPNSEDLSYENRFYQDDMDKATRLVREGKLNEAIVAYRQITQKAPRICEPRFNLARLYERVGQFGLALSEYKRIANLKGELGANHALVIESERAIQTLRNSIEESARIPAEA